MGKPIANVAAFIRGMSFEEREAVIVNWQYDRERANRTVFDTSECKRRHGEVVYMGHWNIDNLYEYCVFKNCIMVLNRCYGTITENGDNTQVHKAGFTLGHWIPMGNGGAHLPSNWFIQNAQENFRAGDKLPEQPEKFDLREQMLYLLTCCNKLKKNYAHTVELRQYIEWLKEVY